MQITTLSAPDIECGGCAAAIKKTLGGLAGVSDVSVDIDSKRVAVSHEDSVTRDVLAAALDKAGFPVAAAG